VKLWSVNGNYHCLATLSHPTPVSALKLSNLLLISATSTLPTSPSSAESYTNSVHLWNLHTNAKIMTWPVSGQGAFITSLASNGSRVYGGGRWVYFTKILCPLIKTCYFLIFYSLHVHIWQLKDRTCKLNEVCVVSLALSYKFPKINCPVLYD
jgi:WD40 repeat protein